MLSKIALRIGNNFQQAFFNMTDTCFSAFSQNLVCTRMDSTEVWDAALAGTWRFGGAIPLPPDATNESIHAVDSVLTALNGQGYAACQKPDVVLAIGDDAMKSARLFGFLSGVSVTRIDADLCPKREKEGLNPNTTILLFFEPSLLKNNGLFEISRSFSTNDCSIGFVNAYSLTAGLVGAIKAAFAPLPNKSARHLFLNTLLEESDFVSDNQIFTATGFSLSPEQTLECLSGDNQTSLIISHGNGFDFSLGSSVLCCVESEIIQENDPFLFTCFHRGCCIRTKQARLHTKFVSANVLVLASCWGTIDIPYGLDHAKTALSGFLEGTGVWNLVTTANLWTVRGVDWLAIVYAMSQSRTTGTLLNSLNQLFAPLGTTFFLFGNPQTPVPSLDIRNVEIAPATSLIDLPAGISVVRFSGDQTEVGQIAVIDVPGKLEFGFLAQVSGDIATGDTGIIFLANSAKLTRFSHDDTIHLVRQQLLESLIVNNRHLEDFVAAVLSSERVKDLLVDASKLRELSMAANDLIEDRTGKVITVMSKGEFYAYSSILDEWKCFFASVIKIWLCWSTQAIRPHFYFDYWRKYYVLISESEIERCSDCGSTIHHQVYGRRGESANLHEILMCRYCGIKLDSPVGVEHSVNKLVNVGIEKGSVVATIETINATESPVVLAHAMFVMGHDESAPMQALSNGHGVLWPNEAMQTSFSLSPGFSLFGGAYWIVVIQIWNGMPRTQCWRVCHVLENGTHVLKSPLNSHRCRVSDERSGGEFA